MKHKTFICQVPLSYTIGLKRSTSCKISPYLTIVIDETEDWSKYLSQNPDQFLNGLPKQLVLDPRKSFGSESSCFLARNYFDRMKHWPLISHIPGHQKPPLKQCFIVKRSVLMSTSRISVRKNKNSNMYNHLDLKKNERGSRYDSSLFYSRGAQCASIFWFVTT